MPTIFTHAVTAAALKTAFPTVAVPRRLSALGAVCAMAPDADVVGSRFGVEYGDLSGHRGITHSILFSICFSLAALSAGLPYVAGFGRRAVLWVYLFLATVSHGLLDACTDGGLGVAFFSPFDTTRYFFGARPIEVSPIGSHFFSERGIHVLGSEFIWVCLPSVAFAVLAAIVRRVYSKAHQRYKSAHE